MQRHEFESGIKDLKERFGDKSYSEKTVWRLFRRIKDVEDGVFTTAVEKAVDNVKIAPTSDELADFCFKLSSVKVKMYTPKSYGTCHHCNGYGYVYCENDMANRALAGCEMCAEGRGQLSRTTRNEAGDVTRFLVSTTEAGKAGYSKIVKINRSDDDSRESPWPIGLEALMIRIKENNTGQGFPAGLRFNKLSEEEAWFLWDCFKNKRFDDPRALKLIARSRGQSALGGLVRTAMEPHNAS